MLVQLSPSSYQAAIPREHQTPLGIALPTKTSGAHDRPNLDPNKHYAVFIYPLLDHNCSFPVRAFPYQIYAANDA